MRVEYPPKFLRPDGVPGTLFLESLLVSDSLPSFYFLRYELRLGLILDEFPSFYPVWEIGLSPKFSLGVDFSDSSAAAMAAIPALDWI
jgi:hypothetical protein